MFGRRFGFKSKVVAALILVPLLAWATTWGPIDVGLFGGNNSGITAAEDQAQGWPGAGAAMRKVLYSAYIGGKLRRKDRIKFRYEDGEEITTVYTGGFLMTSPGLDLLTTYLEIHMPDFCQGKTAFQVNQVVNLDGYWESQTGAVSEAGGTPEYTTDAWWVVTSIGSFDVAGTGRQMTCSAPI